MPENMPRLAHGLGLGGVGLLDELGAGAAAAITASRIPKDCGRHWTRGSGTAIPPVTGEQVRCDGGMVRAY